MAEDIRKVAYAICASCGQKIGFDVVNPERKTQFIRCPVCKQFQWASTDAVNKCILKLATYEESGFAPQELGMLRIFWKECMKYPELKKIWDEWKEKINEDMAEKKE